MLSVGCEPKAVGRKVINHEGILRKEERFDITVQPDDRLVLRRKPEVVTVIGEIVHPTSHLYEKGRDRNDYIGMSGGATRKADPRYVCVVRANGGVIANGVSQSRRRVCRRCVLKLMRAYRHPYATLTAYFRGIRREPKKAFCLARHIHDARVLISILMPEGTRVDGS